MVAIKGYYDGFKFIALEKIPKQQKFSVIITFLDEVVAAPVTLPSLESFLEPMKMQTDVDLIARQQGYKGISMDLFDSFIDNMNIQETYETLTQHL